MAVLPHHPHLARMTERFTVNGLTGLADTPTHPSAPPILFIHGLLAGAWIWERYLPFFAARGHPCHAINLRGRDGSRPVPDIGRVSLADFVEDGVDAARAIGSPIVIGHSMGGLIAQKVAEEGAARALVLIASAPPRGISLASPLLVRKQLKFAVTMLRSRPISATRGDSDALIFTHIPVAGRALVQSRFVPDSGRAARELSVGGASVDAQRVRCPVLVVTGREDRFVVPRVARRLAAKYRATFIEVPEHAHMLPLEPGWDETAADIARWLHDVRLAARVSPPFTGAAS